MAEKPSPECAIRKEKSLPVCVLPYRPTGDSSQVECLGAGFTGNELVEGN
jgi:hypothetical protein